MKKLLVFNTVAVDTLCFQAGTTIHAGQTFELYRDYIDRNDNDVTKQGRVSTRWLTLEFAWIKMRQG